MDSHGAPDRYARAAATRSERIAMGVQRELVLHAKLNGAALRIVELRLVLRISAARAQRVLREFIEQGNVAEEVTAGVRRYRWVGAPQITIFTRHR